MAADDAERSRLIEGFRRAHAAPPARRERVLARVLAPGDVAVFVGGSPPFAAWPIVVLAVAAAVLAVFALEAITGGVSARLGRAPRFEAADGADRVRTGALATSAGPSSRGAFAPAVVPAELPALRPTILAPDPSWADVPVQRPREVASPSAPVPAPVEATLEAPEPVREDAVFDEARRAMRRRGWVDARNALTRHAALFPDGAFAAERRALLVVIACRLDPSEEPRAEAHEFLVRQARSPFLQEVIDACRPVDAAPIISPFD